MENCSFASSPIDCSVASERAMGSWPPSGYGQAERVESSLRKYSKNRDACAGCQVASEEWSACRDSGIHYLREVIARVKLLLKVTADESALSRNHRDA